MAAIASVGMVSIALPERVLERMLIPLVGLAAGSLLGGALFSGHHHVVLYGVCASLRGGRILPWLSTVPPADLSGLFRGSRPSQPDLV